MHLNSAKEKLRINQRPAQWNSLYKERRGALWEGLGRGVRLLRLCLGYVVRTFELYKCFIYSANKIK
jgi:hypothetical protein